MTTRDELLEQLDAAERELLTARTLPDVQAVRRRMEAIADELAKQTKPDTLAEMTRAFREALAR